MTARDNRGFSQPVFGVSVCGGGGGGVGVTARDNRAGGSLQWCECKASLCVPLSLFVSLARLTDVSVDGPRFEMEVGRVPASLFLDSVTDLAHRWHSNQPTGYG